MKKLLLFIIVLPLIYCGIWFYIAHQIKTQAHHLYDVEAPKNGYEFLGDKPKISGFPAKHIITVEKGIQIEGTKIEFEKATIKALPLPNQAIDIDINKISVYDPVQKQLYEIDNISATLIAPKSLPETLTKQELIPWQKDVGKIDIKNIEILKNSMEITAHGSVGLDSDLQADIHLQTKMTDYAQLIHFMTAETSELSPIAGAIALSVLNGLAKSDPETGKKFVEFDLLIKNNRLTLGPLKSIKVPKIEWPEEASYTAIHQDQGNPPALHQ